MARCYSVDLAMANKDGFEVLEDINEDSDLKANPVMVLTSNQAQNSRLFELGIPLGSYCPKPLDPARLDNMVSQLRRAPPQATAGPQNHGPQRRWQRPVSQPTLCKKWWWPFGGS